MWAVRGFLRRLASVVGPSMSGIMTSSRMSEGDHSAAVTSASAPDAAGPCRKFPVQTERHVHDFAMSGSSSHEQNANVSPYHLPETLANRDAKRSRTVATRLVD